MFDDKKLVIREISLADYFLLENFLFYAIHQPEKSQLPKNVIYNPDVYIYIQDYGLINDNGVVAKIDGEVIGMAWTRIIPGFGHINQKTPELAISVRSDARGFGIGTKLMESLFVLLTTKGYKQTSLAVQKTNRAVNFYQRLGYKIVLEKEEEFVMVKLLEEK
ncbi:MAG: GNAT family N-acetyltransferase [Erysipelotrichales bacterium]|nr:GNAT family N-acetyltransferase [Erysipelotrichales bacterium]